MLELDKVLLAADQIKEKVNKNYTNIDNIVLANLRFRSGLQKTTAITITEKKVLPCIILKPNLKKIELASLCFTYK